MVNEIELEHWRSLLLARKTSGASPDDLLSALASVTEAKKLTIEAQQLLTDAFCFANRGAATIVTLSLGMRSLKLLKGRAVIERPRRLSLFELRQLRTVERVSQYDVSRSYTVFQREQGWRVEVQHKNKKGGPHHIALKWLDGKQGICVIAKDGSQIEMCNSINPDFALSLSKLPFEFSLRGVGIPID
ncbi:MAG TPA: hypothetical protein VNK96_05785 [Fimbriimonadales bacterium]|nr:hypothetical protein [Fimbriimonadales bacterium]